jgi:putative transcriptional regulator
MILKLKIHFVLMIALMFFELFVPGTLLAITLQKGMFLIAADKMVDPRFHQGVILLIQHDLEGSAGLVVNRPSRLMLEEILPEKSKVFGQGVSLSYGGPVDPQSLLALIRVRHHPPEPADEIAGALYVTGVGVLNEWPDFASEVIAWRAFVGYTGWAPGQLELEIKRGDWRVVPFDAEALFAPEGLQWKSLEQKLE